MKNILAFTALLAVVLLFTNCKKGNSYKFATYTSTDSSQVFLYINGDKKGELPYLKDGANDCGDKNALDFSLDKGSYTFSVKDAQGVEKTVLTINVDEEATISNQAQGGHTLVQIDKCIVFGIDY